MSIPGTSPEPLSNADVAVLRALQLQQRLDSQQVISPEEWVLVPRSALRPVRPHFDPRSEIMMASGPSTVFVWDAPGDGSFSPAATPVIATGFANAAGIGMAVGASLGTLGANMIGRHQAELNAQRRWMEFSIGAITVSTHGVYLEDGTHGLLYWAWSTFDGMEWKSQSCVEALLTTDQGVAQIAINSDWAELVFVLWVQTCFPQHPQKYSWFTVGWLDRVRAALHYDPLSTRELPPGEA